MKKQHLYVGFFALLLLFSFTWSQQEQQQQTGQRQEQQAPLLKDSDHLKGAKVFNTQGEQIGSVDQIVANLATGRVACVIMSTGADGGLLYGSKKIAVPYQAFKVSQDARLVLDADEQKINGAPAYTEDGAEYFEKDKQAAREREAKRWEMEKQWREQQREQKQEQQQEREREMERRAQEMEKPWFGENGERSLWHSRSWTEELYKYWGLNFAQHEAEYFGWGADGRADKIVRIGKMGMGAGAERTWTEQQMEQRRREMEQREQQREQMAEKGMRPPRIPLLRDIDHLKESKVCNRQGEDIGDVKNLVVNLATGRVAYVIVDTEANGAGRTIAVPFPAFKVSQDARLVLEADEQKLRNAPAYTEDGADYFEKDKREAEARGLEMEKPWFGENGERSLWHSRTWNEEMYRYWGLNFQEHQAEYFGWGGTGRSDKIIRLER